MTSPKYEVRCDPESFRGLPQRGRADSHTGTKASTNHTDLNSVTISCIVFFASPKIMVERVFYAAKPDAQFFSQMRDLINRRLSQLEHGVCLAQSGDAIGNYPRAGIFIFRVAPMNKSAEITLDANFGAQRYQFFCRFRHQRRALFARSRSLGKKCASPTSWPSAITKASNRCKR
jgi:hypothetical protein